MSSSLLLAQMVGGGFSVVNWAIFIVLIAAVFALVALFLRSQGIAIPPLFISAVWIVLAAVIVIAAIIFLARFAGMA